MVTETGEENKVEEVAADALETPAKDTKDKEEVAKTDAENIVKEGDASIATDYSNVTAQEPEQAATETGREEKSKQVEDTDVLGLMTPKKDKEETDAENATKEVEGTVATDESTEDGLGPGHKRTAKEAGIDAKEEKRKRS